MIIVTRKKEKETNFQKKKVKENQEKGGEMIKDLTTIVKITMKINKKLIKTKTGVKSTMSNKRKMKDGMKLLLGNKNKKQAARNLEEGEEIIIIIKMNKKAKNINLKIKAVNRLLR